MSEKKNILILTLLFFVACLYGHPAGALETQQVSVGATQNLKTEVKNGEQLAAGAETFVGSMAQRAIDFLSNEELTREQRRAEFKNLLETSFDMRAIARFSLGRYWRVSSESQRREYLDLFEDMIVDVYSHRFGEYKGQKFEIQNARLEGSSDAIVTSYIVPKENDPEIKVEWRVRYKDSRYRIIDVIVAGVSMGLTQRSDFASVIQRGGGEVQVLLVHLRGGE